MRKIIFWVFLEMEESCSVWAQGGQTVGVQFDLKVLTSSWFHTAFFSSSLGAPLLPVVAGSSQHKVCPKTKTLGREQNQIPFWHLKIKERAELSVNGVTSYILTQTRTVSSSRAEGGEFVNLPAVCPSGVGGLMEDKWLSSPKVPFYPPLSFFILRHSSSTTSAFGCAATKCFHI